MNFIWVNKSKKKETNLQPKITSEYGKIAKPERAVFQQKRP